MVIEGVHILSSEAFEVEPIGSAATGARTTLRVEGFSGSFTETAVAFQIGPVLAAASIFTTDEDLDVRADVTRLATELERRIRGVTLGEVSATPVAIRQAEEEGTVTPSTALQERTRALALDFEDLPAGVAIEDEEFEVDSDGGVEFERDFTVLGVPFGDSLLIGLQTTVEIVDSPTYARFLAETSAELFESELGLELFETAAGDVFSDPEITSRRLDLEDPAFVVDGTASTVLGPIRIVIIIVAADDVIASLTAVGGTAELDAADLEPYAEIMIDRIRTGGRPNA
jgi:hypothetical protein